MKSKRIRTVGYIFMIIGILLPLYAFTNLSFTNLKAKAEYETFIKKQKNITIEEQNNLEKSIEEYNKNLQGEGIVDPFSNREYKTVYDFKKDDPDGIFAYIRIPAIEVYEPIRLDASYEHLAKGVAHIDKTALPVGGIGNRSVIAGHRGWYQGVKFLNVGELKKGDDIFIEYSGKTLNYKVSDTEIIKPYEWEKLAPFKDRDVLTLLTCDPITPPSPYRLLINCDRVETVKSETGNIKTKNETRIVVNKKVKYINIAIYSITILLYILLIFLIFKFVKLLFKK